ncbi:MULTISPECIES: hypothetical protein [unclassified Duganella]|uniref:hypothetical protein n=1 Tax=unclassified Duganella TaxID=2636909 RepID=UPI0011C1495B|nr:MULTISPECIES: hypothetical protein [unclassified Duganella]
MELTQLIEQTTRVLTVVGGLGSVALLVKTVIELSTGPTIRARSEYEFAKSLAQQTGDPALNSYVEELAFKILIGDQNLNMSQRRALLTLPNRVRSMPRYLKSRRFLTVHHSGQVLRWKVERYKSRWYRKSIMGTLFFLYLAFSLVGLPALFGPYPKTFSLILDAILKLPPLASLYFVFLAGLCLFHALTLSTAESLIEEVEAVGPFLQ